LVWAGQRSRLLVLVVFVIMVLAGALVLSGCPQADPDEGNGADEDDGAGEEQQDGDEDGADGADELAEKLERVTKDNAPGGCGDCHRKINEEKDYTLNAEAKAIADHPETNANTVAECIVCHDAESERPFRKILHRAHIIEGEHYTEEYDKNCINCHQVDEQGTVVVKGLEQQ